jgi:hypothetical protein
MIIDTLARHGINAKVKSLQSWEDKIDLAGALIHGAGVQNILEGDVEIKVGWGQGKRAKEILKSKGIYFY